MKKESMPVDYQQCHEAAQKLTQRFLLEMTHVSKTKAAEAFGDFRHEENIRYGIIMKEYDLSESLSELQFHEARDNWIALKNLKKQKRELRTEIKSKMKSSADYGLFAVALRQFLQNIENMKLRSPVMQCIRQNVIYDLRDGLGMK